MVKNFLIIFLPMLLIAQTEPIENLHENPPRVWTLMNAMIHTSPGDFIKDGSITIRNGKIEAVGKKVNTNNIPSREKILDLKGKYIFPGIVCLSMGLLFSIYLGRSCGMQKRLFRKQHMNQARQLII